MAGKGESAAVEAPGSKASSSRTMPELGVSVLEHTAPPSTSHPVLASLHFGNGARAHPGSLSIRTCLEMLPGSNPFMQYWHTHSETVQGRYGHVCYSCSPHLLFGHVQLPCTPSADFSQVARQVYLEIYGCLQDTACMHLLRTWNYFPGIMLPCAGRPSRYDAFCSARKQAMQASGITNSVYPAATVIGSRRDALQVYFLASDTPGTAVENPRQTSAYDYPVVDPHAPPLFSRGVLKTWSRHTHFYVSGTASIVGHETQHVDNVGAQLNESLNNVETLVVHANNRYSSRLNAQDDLLYMKVYVRHPHDVSQINPILAARLPGSTPRILLRGDMCRDDLLVEIEALYQA